MASQTQVLPIQLVTTPMSPELLPEGANPDPISNQVHVTILLQLPGAVGQPNCPTPHASAHALTPGKAKEEGNEHILPANTPSQKRESGTPDERRLGTLGVIVVFAGLILIIPPFASLFGVSVVRCFLAWSWLFMSFFSVVTALFFLNGRISRSDFAKLWKSCLDMFGRSARPPIATK